MQCTPNTQVNRGWIHIVGPESPQQTNMKTCPMQLTDQNLLQLEIKCGHQSNPCQPSQTDLPPNLVQILQQQHVQHQRNKAGTMAMSKRSKTPEAQKPGAPEAQKRRI